MKNKVLSMIVLITLTFGSLTPATQTALAKAPDTASSKGISPEELLKSDGTLNLDGSFNGSLDISGYNVQMDPQRGPVFTSQDAPAASTSSGIWAALGDNGGPVNDTALAIAINGTDVYIGGNFQDVANIPSADYIAKWDGTNWSALGSDSFGEGSLKGGMVNALAWNNGSLYVGGTFSPVYNSGGQVSGARNIAKWDGTNWSALGNNALTNSVYTLAFDDTILYAGGKFTNAAGIDAADYVAKWDTQANTWSALGSTAALNGDVSALAVTVGKVFIGGNFTQANGLAAGNYIVAWDGANWLPMSSSSTPALNDTVFALAASGYTLYVGGRFTDASGINTADYLAQWNIALGSWSALSPAALNNYVYTLEVSGSDLYVGGWFTDAGGNNAADNLAKWNGTTWSALGNNGAGSGAINDTVYALAISGTDVYVGGVFTDVNDGGDPQLQADYLAHWNGTHWSSVGTCPNGALNEGVEAIAVIGGDIYIGGSFFKISNHGANFLNAAGLAKWDGTNWSAVGNFYGSVSALAVMGTDLYVGGAFTDAGGIDAADYTAKWDGGQWFALGNTAALNSYVNALAVSGTDLYVGGSFTNAGGVNTADYIARWNGASWSALGGITPALNSKVNALAVSGTDLYVGGFFTDAGGNNAADYIARWNGTNWSALGNTAALGAIVTALAVGGTNVYVGGNFSNAGGIAAADYIATWSPRSNTWSAVGSAAALHGSVHALAFDGANLYVGGTFTDAAGITEADYAAKWDGSAWSALGATAALNHDVYALVFSGATLYAGGSFYNAAGLPEADYIAAYGIDNTAPTVASIVRAGANPTTSANSADFTVTFSESVTGVDTADFTPTMGGGVSGATVSGVAGSGSSYTVTVSTGAGNGTLRLDIPAGAAINDLVGNPLGGLPYTGGESYTVKKVLTIKSDGAQDGWISESGENTNKGKTINATSTLRLGDDAAKKQYRSVLSFATGAGLPDNAVITKVTLKVKRQGVTGGGDPVADFQGFMVDIRKGTFGTAPLLAGDFQAPAQKSYGPFSPALASGWYSFDLTSANAYINKFATNSGLTQIRLRFKLDDNNNAIANYLSLFSGNAGTANRPQLIVEYHLP